MRLDEKAYWRQPSRWITLCLTCLGVCLLLANLPTDAGIVPEGKEVGHWTSLLPPLMAVTVALFFHSLVWALSAAFVLGCGLAFYPDFARAVPLGIREFIWSNFKEDFNLYIFLFLFALVGMIHVAYRSGGIHGLVAVAIRIAKGPRSAKIATMAAGLTIFFDDYSNTVVVGSTMKKLSDRWRISREKLAYIVDSTTAPIAGLAPLSTWIAFEIFLLSSVSVRLDLGIGGYAMFMTMLPFRFYCWGTLATVFLTSVLGRDFGAMYRAEERAAIDGNLTAPDARLLVAEGDEDVEPIPGKPQRWINAALPLAIVILGALGGILFLGRYRLLEAGSDFSFLQISSWREAFGATTNPDYDGGGAMQIFFWASVAAGAVAVTMALSQRILSPRQSVRAYLRAIPTLWMAIFILTMAWAMKDVCTNEDFGLQTDTYLISLLGTRLPVELLPLVVFLVSSAIAFATGTSFGAMGILIPIILPLAHATGAYESDGGLLFWLASAAIMDGAIFGDHCSPISDTTVLSSISTGCDHIDHVATQVVYALTTMVLAAVIGYLGVAFGMPIWLFFLSLPCAIVALLVIVGKRVPSPRGVRSLR